MASDRVFNKHCATIFQRTVKGKTTQKHTHKTHTYTHTYKQTYKHTHVRASAVAVAAAVLAFAATSTSTEHQQYHHCLITTTTSVSVTYFPSSHRPLHSCRVSDEHCAWEDFFIEFFCVCKASTAKDLCTHVYTYTRTQAHTSTQTLCIVFDLPSSS